MEKRFRLRANSDFLRVRREGRSWTHPLMVLCVLPNTLSHNRFGFSVSRRIGSAVARNRAKRHMREATRSFQEDVNQGLDMVLVARSPISCARYHQVERAVKTLFLRAGLLRADDRVSIERHFDTEEGTCDRPLPQVEE